MSINLKPLYADRELDIRCLSLKNATTEITKCLIGVALGSSLEIIVSDQEMGRELLEWVEAAGHRIIGSSSDFECQRIYIERQF
jgi:hypothetical protein